MPPVSLVRGLREQIVEQLREEILTGQLSVGQPLREAELAKRFGVSRGPIRDALLQLTCEGAAIAKTNRGVFVAPYEVDPQFIEEIVVPLRRRVESFALRKIFPTLADADFARWETILQAMKTACEKDDLKGIAEQDVAFHRAIVERAGIVELNTVWLTLAGRIRTHFRTTYEGYPQRIDIYVEHAALVEIFRQGRVKAAVQALLRNIA